METEETDVLLAAKARTLFAQIRLSRTLSHRKEKQQEIKEGKEYKLMMRGASPPREDL